MMDGNPIYYLPIKAVLLTAVSVAGIIIMGYTLFLDYAHESKPQKIEISTGYETHIVINGDTTKKVYILQDSLSGIVWVGIPGKNGLKK